MVFNAGSLHPEALSLVVVSLAESFHMLEFLLDFDS